MNLIRSNLNLINKIVSLEDQKIFIELASQFSKNFENKTLLLTGGTGFFGKWLTQFFCEVNRRVRASGKKFELVLWTRNREKALESSPWLKDQSFVTWVEADIRSKVDLSANGFAATKKIDFVIHGATAASAALNDSNPLEMYDVIVEGTQNVLTVATQAKAEKFLFLSSGGVYGKQPLDVTHMKEDFDGSAKSNQIASAYAIGKKAAEFLCFTYGKQIGFDVVNARCFAFVGPYLPLDTHFAIGNFLKNAIEGNQINISGDGTPYRSYMYGTDLVEWIISLLISGEANNTYHVGSEDGRSLKDIAFLTADIVGKKLGKKIEVRIAKEADLSLPPPRYVPSTEWTQKKTGLKCKVGLEEAILKTLEWYL